jgi:eukaryotic-like serine/threonine-protein kinase
MGADESLAGRVLAEKYLLIDRLGEGGFGSIWRAQHRILKSDVAVKLIDLDVARKDGAVERFLREAQATAALRSPHVVQVLDYGVDGDQPFIVMELLEGENVADRILRVGPLPPLDVARIVTHVARAIGKAHELGIVHRDLKPENIFLVKNGDEEIAKVLDFGVAKIAQPVDLNQDTYTITGSLIGTPYYMSPEQAQGNKTVDHRSDLWALGVIAFEMLTGQRPFDGDALGDLVLTICVRSIAVPSAVAPVPAGFDAWFARAVERDPDARFQSARDMALALLQVIDEGEGGVRYTNIEDRFSQKPLAFDSGIGADIPSRPAASAFAATVRDDAFAAGIVSAPANAASSIATTDPTVEEHLTAWALFGIAILALAAGAAAVYGVFFLVRAHDASNTFVDPLASTSARTRAAPVASGASKHRFDVTATNRQTSSTESANGRIQRPAPSPPSPSNSPAQVVPELRPAEASQPPNPAGSNPAPLAPAQPTSQPVVVPPAAPPENLAPETMPTPAPIPALSAETQPMSAPAAPPRPAVNDAVGRSPDYPVQPTSINVTPQPPAPYP